MAILTELSESDFEKIFSGYNIGRHVNHKHIPFALQNTVYSVKTTKGMFIVKIIERPNPGFINYEARMLSLAKRNGFPVAPLIRTKSGRNFISMRGKIVTMQKMMPGSHPWQLNNRLIMDIARKQSALDKYLSKIKLTGKFSWSSDYMFRVSPWLDVRNFRDFDVRKEEKEIIRELHVVDRRKLRRSHIHSDFGKVNILARNNRLAAILDWGDVHEDYLVIEIVNFIAASFIDPGKIHSNKIRLYLKEYQKNIRFNAEEMLASYYFIKNRFLGSIAWLIRQMDAHPDRRDEIEKLIVRCIGRYNTFKKMKPESFVQLFTPPQKVF